MQKNIAQVIAYTNGAPYLTTEYFFTNFTT